MQVWATNSAGGYMYSDELSDRLRTAVQPLVRFRQFADAKLAKGLSKGDTFNWNVYSDVATQGGELLEPYTDSAGAVDADAPNAMPVTNFSVTRGTATVTEYGNSVPFTSKLDNLSAHPVREVIEKVLKNDASKALDSAAHAEFFSTPVVVKGTGTGSSAAITKTYDGVPSNGADNVPMEKGHVKLVADELAERNIPAYDGVNYVSVFRPRALRRLKDDLESIHQYTTEGWYVIMNGERGRYEGVRFVEQTHIPQPLVYDASTNTTGWKTADATGARGRGYFFGSDTVIEAVTIPEEIRGKIPTDYGRSRGIAWYALLGYAIVHGSGTTEATTRQTRILRWDSSYTSV